jgi:hypothetical protein
MAEILRAEWFDINNKDKDKLCSWLHGVFFPDLQFQNGVNWVAHYDIVPHPETRYIKGAPARKEVKDLSVPPGQENLVLTSANTPSIFFGPNNALEAMEKEHPVHLSMRTNYRSAVFIEEEMINGPELHKQPIGTGGAPAMQFGSYNVDGIRDDIELAKWYRGERFPRLPVTRGMIRGRKFLSISGWAKHGVLWEFAEMDEAEYSFEHRFMEADRGENWHGRHVLEYVTHAPGSPHAGRRIWPK